jgi:ferredoxin-NADP reductase
VLQAMTERLIDDVRNGGSIPAQRLDVVLNSISPIARDIKAYEFLSGSGEPLPPHEPGAYIDLHLVDGLVRSYSLIPSSDVSPGAYTIAVKRDPASRGGSRYIHDKFRVGDHVSISAPRNNFRLNESADHSVFFAGGIGITPIWNMIRRLESIKRGWTLFYSCRTRAEMAFAEELQDNNNAHLYFDDENQGVPPDIGQVVAKLPKDRHLYCCGPAPMLGAFEVATERWPNPQIHIERFVPKYEPLRAGGFTVYLARSRQEIFVAEGQTILETLLDEGVDVDCSCEAGICGTCVQRVISGIPEHKDSFLSPEQAAENDLIVICCSGSKSERLVLDL